MKLFKRIMIGILATVLTISLTVQVEAAAKKSDKPVLRQLNGTIILHQAKIKESQHVEYKLYAKQKGKWVYKASRFTIISGKEHVYAEALIDGDYAVTAIIDRSKESEKVAFKVRDTMTHKTTKPFASDSFYTNVYGSYTLGVIHSLTNGKKIIIGYDDPSDTVKGYSTSLYYIDAKGKLKLVGTKKLKKITSSYYYPIYGASFIPVKGQRNYAIAQINKKGKVLGYSHFTYDPTFKMIEQVHTGLPTKKMKYKESDWK